MKKVDYIIVGFGLAAISFCEILERHNKSFVVFYDGRNSSSKISGGLYNPVILKRFTLCWNATQQLEKALPMFRRLEKKFQNNFDEKIPVLRKFASIEEQNEWFIASDKPSLSSFLFSEIIKNNNPSINASFGLGKVMHTGKMDVSKLMDCYQNHLEDKHCLIEKRFEYDKIDLSEEKITYENYTASKIIFAEGFGLKKNPFFNDLPLDGNKGELLLIKASDLKLDYILKSSVFLIPQGNDLYTVGATYNFNDKDVNTTKKAKEELLEKLSKLINCDFEIIDHFAGIRPTVLDRRPLVGLHEKHQNLAVLNGLGTRGVMIGPTVAENLFNHLENDSPLNPEIDIKRFYRKRKIN